MSNGNQSGIKVTIKGKDIVELFTSLYSDYNSGNDWYTVKADCLMISENNEYSYDRLMYWKTPRNKGELLIKTYLLLMEINKDVTTENKDIILKVLNGNISIDWRWFDSCYDVWEFPPYYEYDVYKYCENKELFKHKSVNVEEGVFEEISDYLDCEFESKYGELESVMENHTTDSLADSLSRSIGKNEDRIEFENQIFVFSSCRDEEMLRMFISERGGVVKDSTVMKTNYMIIGDGIKKETKKISKARELNESGKCIKALTEKEFWSLVINEV